MSRTLGALAALGLGFISCAQGEPSPDRDLGYRPSVILGSDEGPGSLPGYATDLLRQANGSWVLFTAPGLPMVFTADGDFVGELGAHGEGPGEFETAYFGAALPGDSILVSDPSQGRVQILSPETGSGRSVWLPCGAERILPVAWPDTVLFVGRSCGQALGPWLRLVDLSTTQAELTRSFGDTAKTRAAVDRRVITSPQSGEVWLVHGERGWNAKRWSLDGRLIAELEEEPHWLEEGRREARSDSFPHPAIVAVEVIPGDTLVLGALVPRPAWQEAWADVESPGPFPDQRPHEAELWETLVEYRDPRSGDVLGSQRVPGVLFRILKDGSFATRDIRGPGFPFVTVYVRDGSSTTGL